MVLSATISPQQFAEAFDVAWVSQYSGRRAEIEALWTSWSKRPWTEFMCRSSAEAAGPLCLVEMTFANLGIQGACFDPQRHTVDAFLRAPRNPLAPSRRHTDWLNVVMVEVENEPELAHEEFWKLLHSRVPLKVLITYDLKPETATTIRLLETYAEMYRDAARILGPDSTQYLVSFAGRQSPAAGAPLAWSHYELAEQRFVPLTRRRASVGTAP